MGLKGVGEEEVVPAGRKGYGQGNTSSEGIWDYWEVPPPSLENVCLGLCLAVGDPCMELL